MTLLVAAASPDSYRRPSCSPEGDKIGADVLPRRGVCGAPPEPAPMGGFRAGLASLDDVERADVRWVLDACDGKQV